MYSGFAPQYVLHGIPRATAGAAGIAGVAGVSTRLFRQHHVASFGFWYKSTCFTGTKILALLVQKCKY
jgi:hypothetical protein